MPDDPLARPDRTLPQSAEAAPDPLWYKDAIIYQVHVKAFFDANNDGVGDFQGIIAKLDYLQDLGVTALWLLPFYPSPLRDDGYDIADYRNVNPTYGSMGDFRAFVREAHRRGIRVIIELVINHTSDQHPWFQRARRAKHGSRLRDFYVWSDNDQKYQGTRIIFLDTEKSNWTWDPVAQAYYWHRFYSHQPDLNFDNPRVLRAVLNVMRFWFDIGVDGMRLDAVPYLVEREGTNNENLPETHEVLKKLRAELDKDFADKMLLAEANQWPEDVLPYMGDGDECHMAFHFPLMPRIYMAVAIEDRHPITDIMRQTPDIPANCQWAIFLRNHDELTLEMVTDRERDYLWNYYASDRRARINLGIRRRLATLMEDDRRKIELLNSLLLSMPGTPIVYYGDEIGMGDNIFLGDRDGVRTPMQWTPDRNGGFSRADPARLYLPPIMDPVYGYQAVNVEAQGRSPSSLLNWTKRMIAIRKARRAFGRGSLSFLYPSNRKVMAYLREHEDETILCVVNLSRSPQSVELDLSAYKSAVPIELTGRAVFPPIGDLPYLLTLQAHSFFWFLLEKHPELAEATWRGGQPAAPEFVTLVVPKGWSDILGRHNLPLFTRDVLPTFLAAQRWFAAKGRKIHGTLVAAAAETGPIGEGAMLTLVDVELAGGERQRYFLPLAAEWSEEGSDARQAVLGATLAQVRRFRNDGALFDAMSGPSFPPAVARRIGADARLPVEGGEIRFRRSSAFDRAVLPEQPIVRKLGGEQSNSSTLIEEYAVLKIYRRLQPGINPEIEVPRFLTEKTGFANTPPLLGHVELQRGDGECTALGVLFGFVRNQGEAWTQTQEYLKRYLDEALLVAPKEAAAADPTAAAARETLFYFNLARRLGERTAQLHRALCPDETDDPAFAPEPIEREDLAAWRQALVTGAAATLDALERRRAELPAGAQNLADRLLAARTHVMQTIADMLPPTVQALKTRYHGDYHLGQVLVVQNDFHIIDFEGEPMRPMAERRGKASPLKDVAGMLRSFDYAAATAVRDIVEIQPATQESVASCATQWRDRVIAEFLGGYFEEMRGCRSLPASEADRRALLDFFTLDKAFYEVGYELANRPNWIAIPLGGIVRLLGLDEGRNDGTE